MNSRAQHSPRRLRRDSGFTLIEMMIATVIALFLIGGLLTILQNEQRTHGNQAALAQIQDDQRVAMTLLSDGIQTAGYYPSPVEYLVTDVLPSVTEGSTGKTLAVGQGISGTYSATAPGDKLITRFTAGPLNADVPSPINCNGGTNAAAVEQPYVNTFSVQKVGELWQLVCSVNDEDPIPLVSGITRMQILYGVKKGVSDTNNSVDTYENANEVTAANDWQKISSIKVTLTFDNPLAAAGDPPTTFTRVISVMARAGYKT